MVSFFLVAIGIVVAFALLGSVLIQSFTPMNDVILSPQELKCQEIANEGYRIHTMYPDSNPDDLPSDDKNRLLYIDDLWIKECVSVLPADSLFSIINNVERDFSFGKINE